jgi:hypothetical protein
MVASIADCEFRIPQSAFRHPQWVAGVARAEKSSIVDGGQSIVGSTSRRG